MDTLTKIANLIDGGYSIPNALRFIKGVFQIGHEGYETTYTPVNGVNYKTGLRINDFSNNEAQVVLHRHSTTLPAVLIGTRSSSDDATHSNVSSGDTLMSLIAGGWGGSSYYLSSVIDMKVGSGTVSETSCPGEISFAVAADGSTAPTIEFIIKEGVINIPNIPTSSAGLSSGDVWSNAGVLTIV